MKSRIVSSLMVTLASTVRLARGNANPDTPAGRVKVRQYSHSPPLRRQRQGNQRNGLGEGARASGGPFAAGFPSLIRRNDVEMIVIAASDSAGVITKGGAIRTTFFASGPSRWMPSPPSPR